MRKLETGFDDAAANRGEPVVLLLDLGQARCHSLIILSCIRAVTCCRVTETSFFLEQH